LLHSRVKKGSEDVYSGVLDMENISVGHAGRNSLISLAQIQVMKEIRFGKKSTIVRALRAGKAKGKVSNDYVFIQCMWGWGCLKNRFPQKVCACM
jgi:hypothetical protein